MFDISAYLLLLIGPFSAVLGDSPTVIILPECVSNRIRLPEADFKCVLRTEKVFTDILGHQFAIDDLQQLVKDCHPGIVHVGVDLNRFSLDEVTTILNRMRGKWNPKIKTVIFVKLSRYED